MIILRSVPFTNFQKMSAKLVKAKDYYKYVHPVGTMYHKIQSYLSWGNYEVFTYVR